MVVAKNEDNKKWYDIIDGQQRTTTIFMLLHVLANKQNEEDKRETRKYLYQKGIKIRSRPSKPKLLQNALGSGRKGEYQPEKDADTEGKQNLFEVLKTILDKVSKLSEEGVNECLEVLLEMVLMRLEEPDPGRAIRTFQSVNDRGVPLLLLDKLKSLLIYYSNIFCDGKRGLDQFINDHFGEIFKIFAKIKKSNHISSVGGSDEGDIFRYHAGSQRFDGIDFLGYYKTSTDNTYEKLKAELKKIKSTKSTLESFIQSYVSDLKNFYQAFLDLLSEIDTNPTTLKVMLINKIDSSFFNSLIRLKINNELDDETLKLFAKTDIVFFKSSKKMRTTAYNLINAYLKKGKEGLKSEMIAQCRNDIGLAFWQSVNNASNSSCFHYVFFEKNCQEMGLADLKKLIPRKQFSQEKEHIIPINLLKQESNNKIRDLGFEGKKDLEDYIDTYGNFISLEKSLNLKASDKDLYGKDAIYKESRIPFNRRFNVKGFNKKVLIKRNDEMREWLINTFFKDFATH
ncbi:DUF262 domain-containing protein [Helicobacter pylori]|uniref:DUF262 domain-containing protein n=1 Tax=Helicobacter pylori TaxID=210 RepID=UPI000EB0122D|nr:DUF262 domain-containing protein [Helicobacter pylori]